MRRWSEAIFAFWAYRKRSITTFVNTDHTPGFGSAAKYVASTVREIAVDASVYDNKKSVTIVGDHGASCGMADSGKRIGPKI